MNKNKDGDNSMRGNIFKYMFNKPDCTCFESELKNNAKNQETFNVSCVTLKGLK